MSKYIKLEDAIRNINLEVTGRKEYTGDMKANLFFALDDLPTIEVSEDCISREQVRAKLDYISYAEKDPISIAKRIVDIAPSVVPICQKNRQVERAEGEWIKQGISPYEGIQRCCFCDKTYNITEDFNYCPHCGAKMKGADNYE